ncbi:MAG: DUF971 domain-containing protein [Deltaproteobacteria bacterium]|nr:DUF971 domain-containing protein [Deltaproteobacteria bacterium]
MGSDTLTVTWADGAETAIPNALLRGYCPCAGCQGHSGDIRWIPGGNAALDTIEEVGSYALSFTFGDGHGSGIYTFRYLRSLGELSAALAADPSRRGQTLSRSLT